MPAFNENLNAHQLSPYLQGCGYGPSKVLRNVAVSDNRTVTLTGFAQRPFDSRSACFAAMDVVTSPEADAKACRSLGAPVTFLCHNDKLLWWTQTDTEPYQIGTAIPKQQLEGFFREHQDDFAPTTIYRAKTLGRFEPTYQRSFVDLDLMPVVEKEVGETIQRLMLDSVGDLREIMGWAKHVSAKQGQWLVKSVFWLLAAKMLHDKEVEGFIRLDFTDVDEVYTRLAKHYGESADILTSQEKRKALVPIAARIEKSADLRLATTEALAYVYENTLISDEVRAELGTHSTPSYLVDYIVGRLEPWIQGIDRDSRCVFEPACGHAAFLVAAIRLLTSLLPANIAEPDKRKKYLRERIYGYDADEFAVEIARLSLTLTDIPNPNGWSIKVANLFESDLLERTAAQSTILLANTPFENMKARERAEYGINFRGPQFVNKTAELLHRALSAMPVNSVFGVVIPQVLLRTGNAYKFREMLVEQFDIQEICLFPDKVFNFADQESAVIIGRKTHVTSAHPISLRYRRVREREMFKFRNSYQVTSEIVVNQRRFQHTPDYDLRVPDLERVWEACADLPKLQDYVNVGQGFSHIGEDQPDFPEGAITVSDEEFTGAVQGFANLGDDVQTHQLPPLKWLNLSKEVILAARSGTERGVPQLLLNEAPVQRAPWCLRGMIDRIGRPAKSSFTILRPRSSSVSLEFLWGLINSPVANAYAYAHSTKRHILTGVWREFRIPVLDEDKVRKVEHAVDAYLQLVKWGEQLPLLAPETRPDAKSLQVSHWRIDAEVLRLYGFPVSIERELLDYFAGWRRPSVPFEQDRYFPMEFEEPISLIDFLAITADWESINRRRHELIERKATQALQSAEALELKQLQRLAGLKRELLSSPPFSTLAAMEADLRRRKLWKGA